MGELGGSSNGNPFELLKRVLRDVTDSVDENETDIVETDQGFLISAHVPGVSAEDVNAVVSRAPTATRAWPSQSRRPTVTSTEVGYPHARSASTARNHTL